MNEKEYYVNDYCSRVLSQAGRLTRDEGQDLRAELSGHIEDHAEILTAHGYTEDAAYGRAVALMGDPRGDGAGAARAVRRLVARYRAARRAHPHGGAVRDDRGVDREVERPLRCDLRPVRGAETT